MSRPRVVFFGTPIFAREILAHLIQEKIDVVAVVTMPDRPKGRSKRLHPSPVKEWLIDSALPIPLLQPEKASSPHFIEELSPFAPDLFVVVGYGEIMSGDLLAVPRVAPINIHTSLLPAYRGAAPIQRAIMAGETRLGITVMEMNKKMDAGAILAQASCEVDEEAIFPEVEEALISLAQDKIIQLVERVEKEGVIEGQAQDLSRVSIAPKIAPEDCLLNFNGDARDLHNQVRALSPKPAAYALVRLDGVEFRMKVYRTSYINGDEADGEVGAIRSFSKQGLEVQCARGSLVIKEVQLEGKKRMGIDAFYAGFCKRKFEF